MQSVLAMIHEFAVKHRWPELWYLEVFFMAMVFPESSVAVIAQPVHPLTVQIAYVEFHFFAGEPYSCDAAMFAKHCSNRFG